MSRLRTWFPPQDRIELRHTEGKGLGGPGGQVKSGGHCQDGGTCKVLTHFLLRGQEWAQGGHHVVCEEKKMCLQCLRISPPAPDRCDSSLPGRQEGLVFPNNG